MRIIETTGKRCYFEASEEVKFLTSIASQMCQTMKFNWRRQQVEDRIHFRFAKLTFRRFWLQRTTSAFRLFEFSNSNLVSQCIVDHGNGVFGL